MSSSNPSYIVSPPPFISKVPYCPVHSRLPFSLVDPLFWLNTDPVPAIVSVLPEATVKVPVLV